MNSVFSLIARLKGNTGEQKTGTSELILKNSGWVELSRIKSNEFLLGIKRIEKFLKN
jgi:hypothetical protein